jgi:Ni,Fe-hydrogenase III small subunit
MKLVKMPKRIENILKPTKAIENLLKPRLVEKIDATDKEFLELGIKLKEAVSKVFGRSLAIREVDTGSDNSPEIELINLIGPYYDVERFGITFVASPRHADILLVTGPVTRNMAIALKKTYDAMPGPKWVVALGDDACNGGIFKGSYAVLGGEGGVEMVLPVDVKIPGNPPAPKEILRGLLSLAEKIKNQ